MGCGNYDKIRKKKKAKKEVPKTCGNCQLGRWYCEFSKDTPGCANWIPVLKVGSPKREDPERKKKIRNIVFRDIPDN